VSFFDEDPKLYDWEAEGALAPNDPILKEMADELKLVLGWPPASRAYAEYLRRGGKVYANVEAFATALVDEVVSQAA
jgi:hypothetical protein